MEQPTTAAQDNTATANDGQQQGGAAQMDALIGNGAAPTPEPAKGTGSDSNGESLPFDKMNDGGKKEGEPDKRDGVTQENEAYTLTFPGDVIADPEAVKVLNEVGKEFGVSGEKAQLLATAATEYAIRQVEKNNSSLESGFRKFREENQKATLDAWGADAQRNMKEADAGLAMLQKAGKVPADLATNINTKALCDMRWFLDMCREHHKNNSEQAGIFGERDVQREHAGDVDWNIKR